MRITRSLSFVLLGTAVFSVFLLFTNATGSRAAEGERKVKSSFKPEYPELARRMNIKGVARVEAVVSPAGDVVSVKELGGNPVLVQALSKAVIQWKYEPAKTSSTITISYEFVP